MTKREPKTTICQSCLESFIQKKLRVVPIYKEDGKTSCHYASMCDLCIKKEGLNPDDFETQPEFAKRIYEAQWGISKKKSKSVKNSKKKK